MSRLSELLGLTAEDQNSIRKTTGTIKSVAEFLVDASKAVKAADFAAKLGEIVPWWMQAVGQSAADAAPPIKFIATLFGKLGQITDPDRLGYVAFTTAYQRSVEKALLAVGPPGGMATGKDEWVPKTDVKAPEEGM
jgi:hypothetical protein